MGKDEIKQEIFCILGVPFLIILFFILLNVLCIYVFHIPNSILETSVIKNDRQIISYTSNKKFAKKLIRELKAKDKNNNTKNKYKIIKEYD